MDLVTILADIAAKLALIEAQTVADKQAAYDAGFAAGVASVPVTGGGFTQEQVDALVAVATETLRLEVDALRVEVAALKASTDTKVSEAVAAVKATIAAAYEAQQVAETAGETGFKDLLV